MYLTIVWLCREQTSQLVVTAQCIVCLLVVIVVMHMAICLRTVSDVYHDNNVWDFKKVECGGGGEKPNSEEKEETHCEIIKIATQRTECIKTWLMKVSHESSGGQLNKLLQFLRSLSFWQPPLLLFRLPASGVTGIFCYIYCQATKALNISVLTAGFLYSWCYWEFKLAYKIVKSPRIVMWIICIPCKTFIAVVIEVVL